MTHPDYITQFNQFAIEQIESLKPESNNSLDDESLYIAIKYHLDFQSKCHKLFYILNKESSKYNLEKCEDLNRIILNHLDTYTEKYGVSP